MNNIPKVLGHRGMRDRVPYHENTLDAFNYALSVADGLETDVVLSADRAPYLLHDRTMRYLPYTWSRTFSTWKKNLDILSHMEVGRREFRQLYSCEVDHLYLKYGHNIPRLSHLFSLLARNDSLRVLDRALEDPESCFSKDTNHGEGLEDRKIINLELKMPDTARPTLEAIKFAVEKGQVSYSQIIISSFDHNEIAFLQKLDPYLSIPTGLIFWHDSVRPCRLYPRSEKYLSKAMPISVENLKSDSVRRVMPDYFVLPAQGLRAKYNEVVAAEYPESRFIVWTPGREPLPHKNKILAEKLSDPDIGPRIAAVITNHPEEMKRFLNPVLP